MTRFALYLRWVPNVRGIYDSDGDGVKGEMPKRTRWLSQGAARAFAGPVAEIVTVSDMFRSPDSSQAARAAGRRAAAPGLSSHNYGDAIDIDVTDAMKRGGFGSKGQLDAWMRHMGWACWRNDGLREREEWHYYYAGDEAVDYEGGNAVAWWGRAMRRRYPVHNWNVREMQAALGVVGFYHGAVDGKLGPLTRAALASFKAAWGSTSERCVAFVVWHHENKRRLAAGGGS